MVQASPVKQGTLWDWLTTVDHKKIGILYIAAGGFFFFLAGIEAILMRLQLMYPDSGFLHPETYNAVLTMHGTTMMFFSVLPILFGFMNFIVPLQIGARDVAFPFVNALGFWLFLFGGILLNVSWFTDHVPDSGWTSYAPLALPGFGIGTSYYALSLQISGIGTILGAINFVVTIINMRAPGMSFMRMPLFIWTAFVTSILIIYAFTALGVGVVLLMFDTLFNGNVYDPASGGNPLLWQHIFWIFGHPEVYVLLLPALGIFAEVISTFSRKRIFGYSAMVFSIVLIGFLGFMVWVHHMFTVGIGPVANSVFALTTMAIAVPTGIKIFGFLFTMWGGKIVFPTANLFAAAFIPSFVMGGVTGVMVGVVPADLQYHDSYFIVAHFHYVLIAATVFGIFAGLYYWWPKMFGKRLNETLGKWHFWLFLIGFHLTFFPQHFVGLMGMPRRVFTYHADDGFTAINWWSTIGALIMIAASLILLVNLFITALKKPDNIADPWNGRTLEWSIASPPPEYNFAQIPLVRGLDAFFMEKMKKSDTEVAGAEPVGPIHMPSPSILPFLMSLGLFIMSLGLMYHQYIIAGLGIALTLMCMAIRSWKDDPGYHVMPASADKHA